jgi:hypothetical protein
LTYSYLSKLNINRKRLVLNKGSVTLIGDSTSSFRLLAGESGQLATKEGTAFAMATLYIVNKSGFQADSIYHFVVVDPQERPQADADLELLKGAMDFYFRELLGTEHYIKEIPRNSALYAKEAARLFGTVPVAA